ncbi:cell division protein FtsQ/DivIB [Gordonia sp. (in: high G+C Gram-positive bacteria)]|uniref:cell division protein FtsQ/DivIB n=1 Tax=Gordonia sp. (in: high G+C Gram-positive bacteria) TaxID=84139 RepID=UPI003C72DC1F
MSRRESKRQANHAQVREPSPEAGGFRSRWRLVAALVALIAVVGGLVAAAYFTPLISARNVEVTGATTVPSQEVLAAAQVTMGQPLLQVDTAAIAERVALLPAVESVHVVRNYPSTLTIAVTERTPVVTVPNQGKIGVMDRLGVVYLTFESAKALPKQFRGLPELQMDDPGPANPTTLAVLAVVRELPAWLGSKVVTVSADSPSDVTLKLRSGKTVKWGDAERTNDKAEAFRHLVMVDGTEYNVSSPEYASVR